MTRAAGKPKPPPYPRPVPQLYAEELVFRSDEIVSHDDNNKYLTAGVGFEQRIDEDADAYAARRAAKKRRIEANAEAYLRGQSLYILSAQLTGPFDKTWRNPWSNQMSGASVARRNPMLDNRVLGILDRDGAQSQDRTKHKRKPANMARVKQDHGKHGSVEIDYELEDSGKRQQRQQMQNTAPIKPSGDEYEGGKVVDWLRTNQAYADQVDEPLPHSSPTPLARHSADVQMHRSFGKYCPESESQKFAELTTYERIQQLSRNISNAVTGPTAGSEPGHECNKDKHPDSSRAEIAIAKARTASSRIPPSIGIRTTEKLTSSAKEIPRNVTVSKPQQPTSDNETEDALQHLGSRELLSAFQLRDNIDTAASAQTFETAQQTTSPDPSVPIDVVFNPTCKAGAGEDLAGASCSDDGQTQLALPHKEQTMNVTTAEELDAMPRGMATNTNTIDLPSAQEPLYQPPSLSSTNLGAQLPEPEMAVSLTENPLLRVDPDMDQANPAAREIDQLIQAGSQDLEVGKSVGTLIQAKSLPPIVKSRMDKKRKRTSFAIDLEPSQPSIKRMARVRVGKNAGSSHLFPVSKDDSASAPHYNNENGKPLPHVTNSTSFDDSTRKSSKGILKSTNPTNSQNSNKNMKSTHSSSQQQDGQGNKFLDEIQHAIVDEDEFDLEAAIDDLGSFLGSWDAEKEASGIMN